jgi:hypothetical protein
LLRASCALKIRSYIGFKVQNSDDAQREDAMTTFDDREKGFERKFQLDAEQAFRAQARRDKLFGQWAASELGYTGEKADAYVKAVVASNFEKPGDDDMLGKVAADFALANVQVEASALNLKLQECYAIAAKQIAAQA